MISINLHQIVRFFCLIFTCFVCLSNTFSASIVHSRLTGGGFVILKTEPGSTIGFLEKEYPVDNDGYVAIGFSRQLEGDHQVRIPSSSGLAVLLLQIDSRKYDIQYIEGISPKLVTPPESELDRIYREAALVKQARSNVSSLPYWRSEQFKWPISARITGVYGSQRFYNGEPRAPHWGVDLAAPAGSGVKAPASGKVVLAEPDLYFSGGTLIIDHGGGLTSSFLHLSKLNVQVGDMVKQGETIAEVGATGRVTGPHLDWRMNLNGERVDAALWVVESH